jgi:hypothetical protein
MRPEESPEIPGLDLPELLAPELLHLAGGPGRRLEKFEIRLSRSGSRHLRSIHMRVESWS